MKNIRIIFSVCLALTLGGCLKNNSLYTDFSKTSSYANLPLSGKANFGLDAITKSADTIRDTFAVEVAATGIPTNDHAITLSVDLTQVSAYNAYDPSVVYLPMPASAFVFPTITVTIPAGKFEGIAVVTLYRNQLDPSKSYMLPITITDAPGLKISGNYNTHFFHFIGNDFAGPYKQEFRRYNASDSVSMPLNSSSFTSQPVTFNPVSPTQFEVKSGYAGGIYRYVVSFKKTGSGASAMYSSFAVSLNPDDITKNAATISIGQPPVFLTPLYDPTKSYTFAQALRLFRFQWVAHTSADRYLIDRYFK